MMAHASALALKYLSAGIRRVGEQGRRWDLRSEHGEARMGP